MDDRNDQLKGSIFLLLVIGMPLAFIIGPMVLVFIGLGCLLGFLGKK